MLFPRCFVLAQAENLAAQLDNKQQNNKRNLSKPLTHRLEKADVRHHTVQRTVL
jgi:hypothetical protein